jgi:hypothetical protein
MWGANKCSSRMEVDGQIYVCEKREWHIDTDEWHECQEGRWPVCITE